VRWVVLTDDHPPLMGGVAAFTGRVVAGLRAAGHEVSVFARARPGLPSDGVHGVIGPRFGRHAGTWLGLRAVGAIRGADRVLATTWVAGTFAARLPVPLDVVAHGSDVTRPPVRPAAFSRVWAAADRRFALSAFLAGAAGGAVVLPAPVHIAPDPVAPARSGTWGLVARATPWKGGGRFVRLCAAAGVRGVVVGDGPALPQWRALASSIGAPVRFLGALPPGAVRDVLVGLDAVFLLPRARPDGSGAEGLGLALIEAAALGVPAVGCDTGGVSEAVGPGLILADPDDARASAAQVQDWLRPSRGGRAWSWCRQQHGVDRTVAALASF